jgi:DNA-binding Xre family transcriptional regulator
MAISYIKLWKLLLDKNMKKTDLIPAANISTTTLARLSKNEMVRMDVMTRICKALNCNIGDIMDVLPDVPDEGKVNGEGG